MEKGTIINIISNQYTILSDGEVIRASARGKLRQKRSPMVGDVVNFERFENGARIHSIEKRKNQLLRPPVANLDEALIVTSLKDPDFNVHLLNRLIFMISLCKVEPVLCFTKWDLVPDSQKSGMAAMMDEYRKMGYKVFCTYPGSNDAFLKDNFSNKIIALCGQSGSGKSSMLNRLNPELKLETQEISKALGRGKHTTRASTLYEMEGGYLADTPGFSSLDLTQFKDRDLAMELKPFEPFLGQCRFSDCRHDKEPGCAIKQAVEEGLISKDFYQDYLNWDKEKENPLSRR